jgi:hypothetical protein
MSIALNLFRDMSSRQIQQAGKSVADTGRRLPSMLGLRSPPPLADIGPRHASSAT